MVSVSTIQMIFHLMMTEVENETCKQDLPGMSPPPVVDFSDSKLSFEKEQESECPSPASTDPVDRPGKTKLCILCSNVANLQLCFII